MKYARLLCLFAVVVGAPLRADELRVLDSQPDELLHRHLIAQLDAHYAARREAVGRALESPAALRDYQQIMRARLLELLGPLPERTPLRPRVAGTIRCDGYRIEKLAFQSRPNHHVTCNFYIPDGEGPFPGVLVLCGHSSNGKALDAYQQVCILLAQHGLAALIVDPISQGERYQFLDDEGKPAIRGGTLEHSLLDSGAMLVGWDTVTYELWDNIRALDYLVSREEVDGGRIGVTGNSGGGTQTTYLMAVDDRIGPAAPSCYVSSQQSILATIGSQDGCQQLAGDAAAGIEHATYTILRAPRPTLILAAEQDFFPIRASRETFDELRQVFGTLQHDEAIGLFVHDDKHGLSAPRRQATVWWMRRWLVGDDSPVREGAMQVQQERDLWVTPTGQVGTSFPGERNVTDLSVARARELAGARAEFLESSDEQARRAEIARLAGVRLERESAVATMVGVVERDGYSIEKWILARGDEVPVPALVYVPPLGQRDESEARRDAALYVDGRGKQAVVEEEIAGLLESGGLVMCIDARGWGETTDRTFDKTRYGGSREYNTAIMALQLGRPLLGGRVEDVLDAIEFLATRSDVDPERVELVGIGAAGPVVLHAAYFDARPARITLRDSIDSWIDDVVAKPLERDLIGHVVPGALTKYDLTYLKQALRGRLLEDPSAGVPTIQGDGN